MATAIGSASSISLDRRLIARVHVGTVEKRRWQPKGRAAEKPTGIKPVGVRSAPAVSAQGRNPALSPPQLVARPGYPSGEKRAAPARASGSGPYVLTA